MEIKILGAHNLELPGKKLVSFVIDGVLAVDAGSLTSSLTFEEQQHLKGVLVTHYHFDHIRDLATLAMNTYATGNITLISTPPILSALFTHIMNNVIYPNFSQRPSIEQPSLKICPLAPFLPDRFDKYEVMAAPVNHSVPTVGFQVTGEDSKKLFYTSDTGPGCTPCWEKVTPDLLITEVTMPNRFEKVALETKHLTPALLAQELREFQRLRGYLPPVVLVHMTPLLEEEIAKEVSGVAQELGTSITLAKEGMALHL